MEPIILEHTICSACGMEWETMHLCEFKIMCPECGFYTESSFSKENDEWMRHSMEVK